MAYRYLFKVVHTFNQLEGEDNPLDIASTVYTFTGRLEKNDMPRGNHLIVESETLYAFPKIIVTDASTGDFDVEEDTTLDKADRIKDEVSSMDSGIIGDATTRLGGNPEHESPLAQLAFCLEWVLKRDYAVDFIADGLVVHKLTTTYITAGAALDTEVKMNGYHIELLKEVAIPMVKDRDARMATYKTNKATIEAE